MVKCEFAGRQDGAAVLTTVAIAQKNVFAREGTGLVRDAAIFKETDDGGHGDAAALSMQHEAVLLFSACDALEHEDQCTASAADIDGLVGRVEHEDRQLENVVGLYRLNCGCATARATDFCLRA